MVLYYYPTLAAAVRRVAGGMNLLDSERRVLNLLLCAGFFALGYLIRGPIPGAPISSAPSSVQPSGGVLPMAVQAGMSREVVDQFMGGDSDSDDDDDTSATDSGVPRRDESGGSPYVLLGVISYPPNFEQRSLLRRFSRQSGGRRGDGRVPGQGPHVATEYVFGDSYFGAPPSREMQARLAAEAELHRDVLFVPAREAIPNVGKASEKSAAWWLGAPSRSAARFFCKTDDDSLIHGAHLATALAAAEKAAASSAAEMAAGGSEAGHKGRAGGVAAGGGALILLSYIRWRGWIPHYDFQACGGGWGGPMDAIQQMDDPKNQCDRAEGPFPQVRARALSACGCR